MRRTHIQQNNYVVLDSDQIGMTAYKKSYKLFNLLGWEIVQTKFTNFSHIRKIAKFLHTDVSQDYEFAMQLWQILLE